MYHGPTGDRTGTEQGATENFMSAVLSIKLPILTLAGWHFQEVSQFLPVDSNSTLIELWRANTPFTKADELRDSYALSSLFNSAKPRGLDEVYELPAEHTGASPRLAAIVRRFLEEEDQIPIKRIFFKFDEIEGKVRKVTFYADEIDFGTAKNNN